MKYLYDEISYIRGLVDGLEINKDTKEGKVINKIIDVLESFADAIVELQEDIEENSMKIEEGLSFIEMECPNCNNLIEIDEEALYEENLDIVCPNCEEVIISE